MPVVVAPVLIPLLGFLLCLLLWGLSQAGQTAFRALFEAIFGAVRSIPLVGRIFGKGVDWLIHHTTKPIADYALSMEKPVVGWFAHVAALIEGWAFSTYYTAVRTYDALYNLRHSVIPKITTTVVNPVKVRVIHQGRAIPASLPATVASIPRLWRYVREIDATASHAEAVAERAWGRAVPATLPRALPATQEWLGRTRKQLAWLRRRVRALPEWLTVAGVSAVAIAALNRIGAGWLKCSNWQKIGRTGCRMPTRWLEDLLGLVADFAIISNACLVIPWLERAASTVGVPLVDALSPIGAGLCRGATRPDPLPTHALYLPAVQNTTALSLPA